MDRASRVIGDQFYANALDVLRPSAPFAAAFDIVRIGGVTVDDVTFGADVRMWLGDLGAYHVDVLLAGRLLWRQGAGENRLATPDRAAVFQPVGETVLENWESGCRLLAVKIERSALEAQLQRMTDLPLRGPLRLAPTLDLTTGAGRSWAWLVRLLADDADNRGGLVSHPLIGPRLCEHLLRGLLVAADHQHGERLTAPGRAAAPKAIQQAIDAIHDGPERPYTVGSLAELAGGSIRSLQEGFRRHVGASPMVYLRDVRLARVHEDLRQAPPGAGGVAEVAYRWGFAHLGRFAAQYQAKYGVTPSHTLRAG